MIENKVYTEYFPSSLEDELHFYLFELNTEEKCLNLKCVAYFLEKEDDDIFQRVYKIFELKNLRDIKLYFLEWLRLKEYYISRMEVPYRGLYTTNQEEILNKVSRFQTLSKIEKEILQEAQKEYALQSNVSLKKMIFEGLPPYKRIILEDNFEIKAGMKKFGFESIEAVKSYMVETSIEYKKEFNNKALNTFINEAKKIAKIENTKKIHSFRWNNKHLYEQVPLLLKLLIIKEYIDPTTTEENFIKAFSGEEIHDPLKIRFIKRIKNQHHTSKRHLFYLFYLLEKTKLVDKRDTKFNKEFEDRINSIFVDHKGEPFQNFQV